MGFVVRMHFRYNWAVEASIVDILFRNLYFRRTYFYYSKKLMQHTILPI